MSEQDTQLAQIAEEIINFKGLKIAQDCNRPVPGEGNSHAAVVFIGEAPGFHEDQQGRPFVGQAGKLLDKVFFETLGLKRSAVYITNIVKYRPPNNRDPLPEEIQACQDWLDRQISIISPKIIVTLGRFSMAKFIPGVTISRIHGQPRYVTFNNVKYLIFPMYHPAAALRSGAMMKSFLEDFQKLNQFIHPPKSQAPSPSQEQESTLTQATLF